MDEMDETTTDAAAKAEAGAETGAKAETAQIGTSTNQPATPTEADVDEEEMDEEAEAEVAEEATEIIPPTGNLSRRESPKAPAVLNRLPNKNQHSTKIRLCI